jgi:hypothetical protein
VRSIFIVGYTNLGLIAAWCIGTIVAGLLICQPFAFNWDQTIPGGHCGNQILSFQVTGAINILTDVVVLLMPMPLLYSLQLPLTSRVVLIGVFGVGIVLVSPSPHFPNLCRNRSTDITRQRNHNLHHARKLPLHNGLRRHNLLSAARKHLLRPRAFPGCLPGLHPAPAPALRHAQPSRRRI